MHMLKTKTKTEGYDEWRMFITKKKKKSKFVEINP